MNKQPDMTLTNQRGQLVEFYVPDNELDTVLAVIDGKKFDTSMYDLGDFKPDSDYNPILLDNGDITMAFEVDYHARLWRHNHGL